jgi:hypothetical protein
MDLIDKATSLEPSILSYIYILTAINNKRPYSTT